MLTHGNWNVILRLEVIQSDKNNKKVKDYSYRERLEKLGFTTLLERRMRGDLIKTFKIISEISNYYRHFLKYFSSK